MSVTASNSISHADISKIKTMADDTSKGNLDGKVVVNEKIYSRQKEIILKIAAVAIIVISAAVALAGAGLGYGVALRGTSLVRYTPYIFVGVAIMGTPGTVIASITSIAFGGSGIFGGFWLWQYASSTKQREIITHTVTKENTKIVEITKTVPGTTTAAKNKPKNTHHIAGTIPYSGKDLKTIAPYIYAGEVESILVFQLNHNKLTNLPEDIKSLVKLEKIELADNQFEDLENLELLPNLKSFDVRKNPLKKIPKEIENLKKLETIYIDADKVALLPDSVRNNKNIKIVTDPL